MVMHDGLAPPPEDGPRLGDAFGALLLACWERGAAPGEVLEVVERDDGYVTTGDAARYFAEPDVWPRLDRWACDRAHGRVLDVGAGAGRHALLLQERGHAVIPSASLIPENDPSVLFTTAGTHPLVPYLLGRPHPSGVPPHKYRRTRR